MANHIKEVSKLLGVEVGEVFQVDGDPSIKDCFLSFRTMTYNYPR